MTDAGDLRVLDCPYCGEPVEVYLEADVFGEMIQDCEVCCNPWRMRVSRPGGELSIAVDRLDG